MRPTTDLLGALDATGQLHTIAYKKGDLIVQPERENTQCYIIRDGLIKAYTINRLGEEEVQAIYGKGELFPLLWIIDQENTTFYFQALSDCSVAAMPQVTLSRLSTENEHLANLMLRRVMQQFAVYVDRINNLAFKYGRERVAYCLLDIAVRFGQENASQVITLPRFSQQDIAAIIHTSRESVNRELSRFEKLGAIQVSKGRITILDSNLLRQETGQDKA